MCQEVNHRRLPSSFCGGLCILLVTCCITGCASKSRPSTAKDPLLQANSGPTDRSAEVQLALMEFADRFIPALAEACDYIGRNAKTNDARLAAQGRKVGASYAALKNAVNPYPYAGLLDMVVMVTLLSDVAELPSTKDVYGPYGQRLTSVLSSQKKEVWALAGKFVTSAQLQELRESIAVWQNAHPDLRYVGFVRIGQFPETTQLQESKTSRRPNSVFALLMLDPLSNLDPAVREFQRSRHLAERAFYYLQHLPLVIAWQTDQMYAQMLNEPHAQQAFADVSSFVQSTTRFTADTKAFAGSIEKFRSDIPQLRRDAIEQMEQSVARQRDSAVRQAATQISSERDAAVRQVATAVRAEQQELAGSLQQILYRSIERIYWRCIVLICVVVIAAVMYQVIVRWVPARRLEAKRPEEAQVEFAKVP
jgi:hypothetical protein